MPVEHTQHHAASRHFLLRQLHARPRLFSAVALAALIYGLLPFLIAMHPTTHLLIAWNTGIGMYLLLAGGMVLTMGHTSTCVRAHAWKTKGDWP